MAVDIRENDSCDLCCFYDDGCTKLSAQCTEQSRYDGLDVVFKLANQIPQPIAQALYEELRNLSEMSNDEFRARVDSGFIDKLLDGVKGLG